MNIKSKLTLCTGCYGSGDSDLYYQAGGEQWVVCCTCGKSGVPMGDMTAAIDYWNTINGRPGFGTSGDEHSDTDFTGQHLLPAILRRQAS